MSNIILIGMPGSGKSTLGVLLAKAIGYSFIDSDLVIQKREGRKLYEIINSEGLDAFIKCESRAVCSIDAEHTVIATGGSVVLDEEGMEHLSRIGKIVYIKLPPEHIERRIRNIKTRGIVMAEGESIYDVYNTRAPLYEKYADITVEPGKGSIENTIEKLIKALEKTGSV